MRKDYDEIKDSFARYIAAWSSRDPAVLDSVFDPNVRAWISTAPKMPDGSQDSIFGMRDFVRDFPKTDLLHTGIYNYVCRMNQSEAQQYAEVVCRAMDFVEGQAELACFEFTCAIVNHWRKTPSGWRVDCMKMDVVPHHGALREKFAQTWFLQDAEDRTRSKRDNCINGEMDSPWYVIPDAEEVLTEEEKVKEVLSKYAYGVGNAVFTYCYEAYSKAYGTASSESRGEGRSAWITDVKNRRMADRYWVHPFRYTGLELCGNRAFASAERPSGHRLRTGEYVWTRENCDLEHCCARMDLEYAKEADGVWRLVFSDYRLGLYEAGPYPGPGYGDLV